MPRSNVRRIYADPPFMLPDPAHLLARWQAAAGTFQDAALTTPAVANADPVGGWVDQSGNGNTATQATAGSRPTLRLGIFKGSRPGLLFTAASVQSLLADTLAASFSGDDKPFTFISVYALTATSTAACHFSIGRGASATPYSLQQISAANVVQINKRDDAAASFNATVTLPTQKTNIDPHCVAYVYDGAFSRVYVDGLRVISLTASAVGVTTLDRFTIGAWRRNEAGPTYASHFPGYHAEDAVYSAALEEAEVYRWMQYAHSTYGTPLG